MNYQLCRKDAPSTALATADFDDDFAAEKWARQWAEREGSGADFVIRRSDGGLSAQLFRTVAGQWYIMRQ